LKKILIYHIGQLGDSLVTIPAIKAIKQKHQNCSIVLLTDEHIGKNYVSSWDVLKTTHLIDQVIFYEPSKILKLKYLFSLLEQLRDIKPTDIYNLVLRVNLKSKCRDYLFFRTIFKLSKYTSMDIIKYPPQKNKDGYLIQNAPQWKRLVEKVSGSYKNPKVQLPIQKESLFNIEKLIQPESGFETLRVVIGPSSKMPAKCWPSEFFIDLGAKLINRYENIEIFIVGGPEDYLLADSLLEAWGVNKIQNYCGKLTISESAELIRKCNIYIGNDTGIMHLAAMVGTVCLTIFSSRDYPGLWEPYGVNHVSIRKKIDCEGCMLVECNKLNNACLKLTSVDEVFSEVTKILSSNGFK
jgi:heptosyltransferase III